MTTILRTLYQDKLLHRGKEWEILSYRNNIKNQEYYGKKLRDELDKEQRLWLLRLTDAILVADDLWAEHCFVEGVRMGAEMVLELCYDNSEKLDWNEEQG